MSSESHPDQADPQQAGSGQDRSPAVAGQGQAGQGQAGQGQAGQGQGAGQEQGAEQPAPPPDPTAAPASPQPAAAAVAQPAAAAPPVQARAPSLSEIAEQPVEPTQIDQLLPLSGIREDHPQFGQIQDGLKALFQYAIRSNVEGNNVDVALVDLLIAELTEKLSCQINEILHLKAFQQLEAAWRGLRFVIDRVNFNENVEVEMLNVSKQDLLEDFQDSPEIPKCGMYRLVYSAEFGQFGGKPIGLIVGNYEFAPVPQDIYLLDQCAAVATMSHAPFVAAASPRFFGLDEYATLPQLKDLAALFEGPQYTKWRSFRDTNDSQYVGLCMPRFLMRLPYGAETVRVRAFDYEEDVSDHEHYLWGNAAFAFSTRVADSFAKYRWCTNVIGPSSGGTVDNLLLHEYESMGHIQTKIPTEIMVTERREWELSEEGFIALTYRPDSDNACFFSANSTQKPKTFGRNEEGVQAALNYRLGTQLPYLFITCRLAHYIKVLQREHIGGWKERQDMQRGLQTWVNQYVADQEVISAQARARRPLRKAQIEVTEVEGSAGWFRVDMRVRPHFKYMGVGFELGLVGRLDKE